MSAGDQSNPVGPSQGDNPERHLIDAAMKQAESETVRAPAGYSPDQPQLFALLSKLPQQLGPIRLLGEIGRGGMGVVFRGRDAVLHREVAVKFLLCPGGPLEEDAVRRFLEGARAAAQVKHLHLTTILHADQVHGIPYLVMEFVRGEALQKILQRRGRLTVAQTLAVLDAVCDAVAALHQSNILHLDIKPSNILIDMNGRTCVTDFGLSLPRKAAVQGARHAVAGTPPYMAPEMFDGILSPRTDVYAIGITAYELLCGHVPFPSQLPIRRFVDALPAELVEQIERATNKQAIYRHKSAAQLRATLRLARERLRIQTFGPADLANLLTTDFELTGDKAIVSVGLSSRDGISERAARKRRQREKLPIELYSIPQHAHRLCGVFPELLQFDSYAEQAEVVRLFARSFRKTLMRQRVPAHLGVAAIASSIPLVLLLHAAISRFGSFRVFSVVFVALVVYATVYVLFPYLDPTGVPKMRRQLRTLLIQKGKLVCAECGFDLRSATQPRCSECGRQFINAQFVAEIAIDGNGGSCIVTADLSGPTPEFVMARLRHHLVAEGVEGWSTISLARVAESSDKAPGSVCVNTKLHS